MSCKQETYDPNDISGSWYYVFNDSIYGEVIFTKTTFWEYTEQRGTFGGRYIIEDDSFKTDINDMKKEFKRIDIDEFTNTGNNLTTKYYRLSIPIDSAGLIRNNEDILENYIGEWKESMIGRPNIKENRKVPAANTLYAALKMYILILKGIFNAAYTRRQQQA